MIVRLTQALGALVFAAVVSTTAQAAYIITVMDLAGGTDSTGWDINNVGVFVGSATVGGQSTGYLVNGGVTTTINFPGSVGTNALGISDAGVVVGNYYTGALGTPNHGYIDVGGTFTTLDFPGATDTFLRGISPNGRYVTGYATDGVGYTSFVYDRTASTFITLVQNSPFLTIAQGVTNAGLVVGNYSTAGGHFSFTYDIGTATQSDFTLSPAIDIRYRGINENGVIDGLLLAPGEHGFIGSASLYDLFDVPGSTSTALEGINDAGWLAGQFMDVNGSLHAFLAQPAPEPGTLALLGLGLAGLAASRRRKQ